MLGGTERPKCRELWAYFLLDVYWRLGQRKTRMPTLQKRGCNSACFAFEGLTLAYSRTLSYACAIYVDSNVVGFCWGFHRQSGTWDGCEPSIHVSKLFVSTLDWWLCYLVLKSHCRIRDCQVEIPHFLTSVISQYLTARHDRTSLSQPHGAANCLPTISSTRS